MYISIYLYYIYSDCLYIYLRLPYMEIYVKRYRLHCVHASEPQVPSLVTLFPCLWSHVYVASEFNLLSFIGSYTILWHFIG